MNRRKFLTLVGGSTVLAAGGIGLFAGTRRPSRALEPWELAGGPRYADPRMHALSYAILAPNPHNRQPWLVELLGDDRLVLTFDRNRDLPHTDPLDRQLTIGLGCFLELMTMAANAAGHEVALELFPEGSAAERLDERPVAVARFSPNPSLGPDPLWPQVMARRSNKEPFDTGRPVPRALLGQLLAAGTRGTTLGGSLEAADIAFFRNLSAQAFAREFETPRTYRESVELFRIGKQEVNASPDGIDFHGPLFEAMALAGLFSREAALDRDSSVYRQGLEMMLETCHTAMGHLWMVTETNGRRDQIAAGADWLRVNLAATRAGLGFQPLSQALQEYPEMQPLYQAIHRRLAPGGGTVQMLARIGYGPQIEVSPRWPIETRMV